jgi:hypothetical protein
MAEFEEVRREGAQFMELLASHVGQAATAADAATQRVSRLDKEMGLALEETRGRFEALSVMHTDLAELRFAPHLKGQVQWFVVKAMEWLKVPHRLADCFF